MGSESRSDELVVKDDDVDVVAVVLEVELPAMRPLFISARLRIARQRPCSSSYLTLSVMSATTTPGPRMAPMNLMVMLPVSWTREWQSVRWSTR